MDQTRRLAADTLHRRLDGSAQPEELEPLIAQVNELLGRLELAYEQLEGFNADVAHESRMPLATLIGSTELALRKARDAGELREVLGSNLEELQRLAGIVHDMLFLSQADRGASARRVPTPSLAALARQVSNYHASCPRRCRSGPGDCRRGRREDSMRRCCRERCPTWSAMPRATPSADRPSRVQITGAPGDDVLLCVVNRGAPIGSPDLPRLFDRFYRADPSRSDADRNHGLGLSIVAAIARMHGGRPLATSSDGVSSIGMSLPRLVLEPGRALTVSDQG